MTRKHFQAIARALANSCPPYDMSLARAQWLFTCECLADEMALQNSKFDRDRFIAACEPTVKEMTS